MKPNPFSLVALAIGFQFITNVSVADTISVWADFKTDGDIAYLLRKSPSQVMQYDMVSEVWLDPIVLSEIPDAFTIDGDYIYVGSGRSLDRYDIDGSNEVHIANTVYNITSLELADGFIFALQTSSVASFNQSSFELIENYSSHYSVAGASISPSHKRLFARSTGVSPSDIRYVEYSADGTFTSSGDSPYHGDYPGASKTWVFPDQNKVADDSGTVYNAADLTYNNAFGGTLSSLTFLGQDIPIALIGEKLYSYSNALLETGQYQLSVPNPTDIAVHDDSVVVFYEDATLPTKVGVTSVVLSDLSANPPGEPVSPIGLSYTVDDSAMDSDGILYLLSKAHSSLFRWDTDEQSYIDTIPLPEACSLIEYDATSNRLYLYAPPRKVYQIDLNSSVPSAAHLLNVPSQINKLIPMGTDLLALQNGSWNSQWLYDQDGTLLKTEITCCYDDFHFYDAATNLLYYGGIRMEYLGGGIFGSPESGGQYGFSPIAMSPDGTLFVDGSGLIYSASTREQIDTLSNDVSSAVWDSANGLYSVERSDSNDPDRETHTTLQKWSEYNALLDEIKLEGQFISLHVASGDNIILTTSVNDIPNIHIFDTDFSIVAPNVIASPELSLVKYSATAATMNWADVYGEQLYRLERKTGESGAWAKVAELPYGTIRYTDVTLQSGLRYSFRLRAENGSKYSEYSNEIEVDIVSVVDDRIDPTQIYFGIDEAFLSADDRLYLLSKVNSSIFVWDARVCDWVSTIPLEGEPTYISYSQTNNAIYTAYANGQIYSISLAPVNPVEILYQDLGDTSIRGMVAAGAYVAVSENSRGLSTYDPAGSLADSQSYRSYSVGKGVWSDFNSKIYHFRDGTSPNDLIFDEINADGSIGSQTDSPYHSSSGIQYPIRVSPTGSFVLLGSGRIYNASTLEQLDDLQQSHVDAAWVGSRLYTLTSSKIIAWNLTSYSEYKSTDIDSSAKRILATSDGNLILISGSSEQTFIDLVTSELEPIAKSSPIAPKGLRAVLDEQSGFKLAWSDVTGETGYTLQRMEDGSDWTDIVSLESNTTTAADSNTDSDGDYRYRVVAEFGEQSAISELFELSVRQPEQVAIPTVDALSESELSVDWSAVANALKYRIEGSQDQAVWRQVIEVDSSITKYVDQGLYRGSTHYYRITAIGITGPGEASEVGFASTLIDPPLAVDNLAIIEYTALSATLGWSSSYESTGYRVERLSSGGGWGVVEEVDSSVTRVFDRDLDPETNYSYRVFAFNAGGDSQAATSSSFTTPVLEIPGKPTHRAFQASGTEVKVLWTPIDEAQGYKVYRRLVGETQWLEIVSLDADTNSYLDDTVSKGLAYEYVVGASNAVGASPYSDVISVTIASIAIAFEVDFETQEYIEKFNSISGGYIKSDGSLEIGDYMHFEYGYGGLYSKEIDASLGGRIVFDIRSAINSQNGNVIAVAFWNYDLSEWIPLETFDLSDPKYTDWTTLEVLIPIGLADPLVLSWNKISNYNNVDWSIDNIMVFGNLPAPPSAPSMAIISPNPSGGLGLFWLPSDRAKTYDILRSIDGGNNWESLDIVTAPATSYHDATATGSIEYLYQVVAANSGGNSSPITSNAGSADDALTNAFEAGKKEVLDNLISYGLFPTNTVSHLHFKLAADILTIDGNLLTIPWILYKSTNLETWTEHPIKAYVELGEEIGETSVNFFKIAPNLNE